MISLWDLLVFHVWWPIQVGFLAVLLATIFMLAVAIFGWERVQPWIMKLWLPLAILLAAFGLTRKSQQEGYQQRKGEEQKAQDEASEFAAEKRDEVHDLPPEKIDDRFDRWGKK